MWQPVTYDPPQHIAGTPHMNDLPRIDHTITIGKPSYKVASNCAACAPFRHRYRESLIPIRLNDTGETIVLGATCLRRIFSKYFADKGLEHRQLTGPLFRIRRTLLIDLAADMPPNVRSNPRAESAWLRSNPKPQLLMSPTELRLYLQQDIIERMNKT